MTTAYADRWGVPVQASDGAAVAWADGDWQAAARALERALLSNPRDLLALKVAQD